MICFNTYGMTEEDIKALVPAAISAGVVHFDSAPSYGNEALLGAALATAAKPIHITTKLPRECMTLDGALVEAAVAKSLADLGVAAIDMYLLHWPGAAGLGGDDPMNRRCRIACWRKLEELHQTGVLRSIGVSDFTAQHITQLMEDGAKILPHCNHIEFNLFCRRREVVDFCRANRIQVFGYCVTAHRKLLKVQQVKTTAEKHSTDGTRVLFAWARHHGVNVIHRPKVVEGCGKGLFDVGGLDGLLDADDIALLETCVSRKSATSAAVHGQDVHSCNKPFQVV
eukprot:PhM_4_TR6182/c0_g1_i1/m.100233